MKELLPVLYVSSYLHIALDLVKENTILKVTNTNYPVGINSNAAHKPQSSADKSKLVFADAIEKSLNYIEHQAQITAKAELEEKRIQLSNRMFGEVPVEFLHWLDLSDPNVIAWLEVEENILNLASLLTSLISHGGTAEDASKLSSASLFSQGSLPMENQHALVYMINLNAAMNSYGGDGSAYLVSSQKLIELIANGVISIGSIFTGPQPDIKFIDGEMHLRGPNSDSWHPLLEANLSEFGLGFTDGGFADWWEHFWEHLSERRIESRLSEETRQLLKAMELRLAGLRT